MTNINKIVIALCEGPHDTAFLYRVLRSDCYKLFSDKIDELPNVVKQFIRTGYDKINELEDLKLDSLRNSNIPNKILYKEDTLILLYAMGGDSEKLENSKRLALINSYLATSLSSSNENSKEFNPLDEDGFSDRKIEYSFLFFYDADNDASIQVKKTNEYLKVLEVEENINHNQYVKKDNITYGCFIFSEDGKQGALENIMFSIIETEENKTLLEEAFKYFDLCDTDRYSTKRSIKYYKDKSCEEIDKNKKSKIYEKKSVLGILGQLQNSGASNVVTIEHSDYIKLEKGSIPNAIQNIIDFFNNS